MTLGLFAISLFVSAKGPTQDLSKTIISYKISHASLKQAFRKIEAATRLNFSYRTDDVLRYTDISFSSPGISVEKLLNALLANSPTVSDSELRKTSGYDGPFLTGEALGTPKWR